MDPKSELKQEATSLREHIQHMLAGGRPGFLDSCNQNVAMAQIIQQLNIESAACVDMKIPFLRDLIKQEIIHDWGMSEEGHQAQVRSLRNQGPHNLDYKPLELAAVGTSASLGNNQDTTFCSAPFQNCPDKQEDINVCQTECKAVQVGENSEKTWHNCVSAKDEEPKLPGDKTLWSLEGNILIKNCRVEEPDECHVSDVMLSSVSEKQERSQTKIRDYVCDNCGRTFYVFSRLKRHMQSHLEVCIHKSIVCDVMVASKNCKPEHKKTKKLYVKHSTVPQLKSHRRTHKKDQLYSCNDCGIRFEEIQNLKKHIRSHLDQKLHLCDICGVSFSYKCNMMKHRSLHKGMKPFKCEFCGLGFSTSYIEQEHRRTHTQEKPHLCHVCGATFTSKGNMLKHRRVHTGEKPYKCDICGVAFAWPWHLVSHKRTHTGEKPYKCDICGAGFIANSNLKKHRVIHTGEKNYECGVCGKRFARQTNLQSHAQVHTKKKK